MVVEPLEHRHPRRHGEQRLGLGQRGSVRRSDDPAVEVEAHRRPEHPLRCDVHGNAQTCDQGLDPAGLPIEDEHGPRLVWRVHQFGHRRVTLDDEMVEVAVFA